MHPLIPLPRAPAAHQFDLQVVQRVDIGKAVANRTRQGGVVRQALLVAGNARQHVGRAVPLLLDGAEHLLAQARILHQLAVA